MDGVYFTLENVTLLGDVIRAYVWEHNERGPNRGNDIRGTITISREQGLTLKSQSGAEEVVRWLNGRWYPTHLTFVDVIRGYAEGVDIII